MFVSSMFSIETSFGRLLKSISVMFPTWSAEIPLLFMKSFRYPWILSSVSMFVNFSGSSSAFTTVIKNRLVISSRITAVVFMSKYFMFLFLKMDYNI